MNERGRKRSQPGDRKNKDGDVASDAAVAEVVKATEAGLAGFEQHKKGLLDELSNAYERGPKSKSFDAEKAWRSLTSLAQLLVVREPVKKGALKAADRQATLRQMAKALARAREAITDTLQSDAANDLISTWWDAKPLPKHLGFWHAPELTDLIARRDFIDLNVFQKTGELLAALETISLRAADEVPTRRGRPKGTSNLPQDFIATLAITYRQSTGLKPGAGEGPFARFVWQFLTAMGRRYQLESVIDDIMATRTLAQKCKWRSSPFDDSFDEPLEVSFDE